MKHAPQGLPNRSQLQVVLRDLDHDFNLFDVHKKTTAIRDSADCWKQMARDLRKRFEDDMAPLANTRLQRLVDKVLVVSVAIEGYSHMVFVMAAEGNKGPSSDCKIASRVAARSSPLWL